MSGLDLAESRFDRHIGRTIMDRRQIGRFNRLEKLLAFLTKLFVFRPAVQRAVGVERSDRFIVAENGFNLLVAAEFIDWISINSFDPLGAQFDRLAAQIGGVNPAPHSIARLDHRHGVATIVERSRGTQPGHARSDYDHALATRFGGSNYQRPSVPTGMRPAATPAATCKKLRLPIRITRRPLHLKPSRAAFHSPSKLAVEVRCAASKPYPPATVNLRAADSPLDARPDAEANHRLASGLRIGNTNS